MCIMFNIYSYSMLQKKLPYINKFKNLDKSPFLQKTDSRSQNIFKAREKLDYLRCKTKLINEQSIIKFNIEDE